MKYSIVYSSRTGNTEQLANAIREALLNRGIYRTVSTILTQVTVDPYGIDYGAPTRISVSKKPHFWPGLYTP